MYDVIVVGGGTGGAAAAYFLGMCNPQMIQTFADMLDERASYFDISKRIPLALLGISSNAMRETRPAQGKVVGGSSE